MLTLRSETLTYSKQKKYVESKLKRSWLDELDTLEAIQLQSLTKDQVERLALVKDHLKKLENKEIDGYKIRTRNMPHFEKSDPSVSFFSRLEKRFVKRYRVWYL